MNIVRSIFGEIRFRDKASGAVDKVNKKMDSSKAKALGLQSALTAIGGAYFIKKTIDVVGNLIELSSAFEQTKVSFEVMLGSAEKAEQMVKQLDEFSNLTPFTPEAVNENAKMLLSFGIAAEKVLPTLQMLGDVSGGNAEKLNRLSLVFGQISTVGRLMGQDLMQLRGMGFDPLREISIMTGKSIAQLQDEMSKGKISFDMVQEAFKHATSEGGRFYEMMVKQSATWAGLSSTLEGLKNTFLREIGNIIIKALKPLMKNLIEGARWITKVIQTKKGLIILKGTLIALSFVIGTLVVGALYAMASAALVAVAPLLPIIGIILLIAAALGAIYLVYNDIMVGMKGGKSIIYEFFKPFYDWVEKIALKFEWLRNLIAGVEINEAKGGALTPEEKERLKQMGFKKRAAGGPVKLGESYVIGEEGPEFFTPGTSGYITPAGKSAIKINSLVGQIIIYANNAKEGAEKFKMEIMKVLNDLADDTLAAELGVTL